MLRNDPSKIWPDLRLRTIASNARHIEEMGREIEKAAVARDEASISQQVDNLRRFLSEDGAATPANPEVPSPGV